MFHKAATASLSSALQTWRECCWWSWGNADPDADDATTSAGDDDDEEEEEEDYYCEYEK